MLLVSDVARRALDSLLRRYDLDLVLQEIDTVITGSFWGDSEAGIVGRDRLMLDMDAWGYSFRLGKTRDWFQNDAEDAAEFLMNHGLLSMAGEATFRLRQ